MEALDIYDIRLISLTRISLCRYCELFLHLVSFSSPTKTRGGAIVVIVYFHKSHSSMVSNGRATNIITTVYEAYCCCFFII